MKKLLLSLILIGSILPSTAQKTLTDTVIGIHDFTKDINVGIYSLDGRRFIAGSNDRSVRFYDANSWYERYAYTHFDQVTHVAISRDNSIIASASKDNKLKIYFEDSAKMLDFEQEAPITGMIFDYGLRFLYTASSDGNIRSYDLRKGEQTKRKFSQGMPITAITITHTNMLLVGLQNGEIRAINYLGKEAKKWEAHTAAVTDLNFIFYKNKMLLASGSEDKLVKVWDVKKYKELKTFTGHTWTVNKVELSRDLKFVMSAGKDGSSKIWNISTGEQVIEIPSKGETTRSISMNSDNSQVATASLVRQPSEEYIIYIYNTGLEEKPEPPKGKGAKTGKDAKAPKPKKK